VLAAFRVEFAQSARRMLAGEKAADVYPDHVAAIENAFTTLESGIR
jgi:hypothetical protein